MAIPFLFEDNQTVNKSSRTVFPAIAIMTTSTPLKGSQQRSLIDEKLHQIFFSL